jgi:hypothetical protein
MRVLFLGAGASHKAGYPLGGQLIAAVEKYMTEYPEVNASAQWSRFLDFRDLAKGTDQLLMESTDPEVVLSHIDLCIQALRASDQQIREAERIAVATLKGLPADVDPTSYSKERGDEIEALYKRQRESRLFSAVRGRQGFLIGLYEFLEHCHFRDSQPDAVLRRDYLVRELSSLEDGDVVITTNYDTLAERILLDQGRWSFRDGYGFDVPLRSGLPDYPASNRDLPDSLTAPSCVRVLKLHGSYGWQQIHEDFVAAEERDNEQARMFFESGLFQGMPAFNQGELVLLYDQREKRTSFPVATPLLAYPSYLKPLGVQRVWEEAKIALERATSIDILGASLPPADVSVRTLFNACRFRLAAGSVVVRVHDKNKASVDRWREHLGHDVQWIKRYAGEVVVEGR